MHREGDDVTIITWGAMVYTATEAAEQLEGEGIRWRSSTCARSCPGTSRRSRECPQDVEGARPPRGHAHRRLRRRDRGDDRRGGVRGPRRAGEADHGARLPGAVLARAREGVHPAGRRRGERRPGPGELLMATTIVDVVMPQMGVCVTEGTILKWLKQEGETIEADEPLLEISTDKVDTEVPSPGSGVVQQILVPEGETVAVGTRLAVIAPEGAEIEEAPRRSPSPRPRSPRRQRTPLHPPCTPGGRTCERREDVRIARRGAHRGRARHRRLPGPRHRLRRSRDEEGHPRVRRVRAPAGCGSAGRGARREPAAAPAPPAPAPAPHCEAPARLRRAAPPPTRPRRRDRRADERDAPGVAEHMAARTTPRRTSRARSRSTCPPSSPCASSSPSTSRATA